eukprot:gene16166-7529_t
MRNKHQNNVGKVTEGEKSKATNNAIGSCSDGNDSGVNETVRNERRSGSSAHVTSGSETKRNQQQYGRGFKEKNLLLGKQRRRSNLVCCRHERQSQDR